MPANLTPQYHKAEARYKAATDDPERLAALREMLQTLPKHKGTEKIQADLKSRISKLKDSSGKKGGAGRRGPALHIERSGGGQVVLVGPPNAGKSTLFTALTGVPSEIADYPGSTRTPLPGMMRWEDIGIQLVDAPPAMAEYMESWYPDLVRNADAILLVYGLASDDLPEETGVVALALARCRVHLEPDAPPEEERAVGWKTLPVIAVGAASDDPDAADREAIARELAPGALPPLRHVSAHTGAGLDELRRVIVDTLDLIRVYTKHPGRSEELGEPFVLKRGSTVLDAARAVHKEVAETLETARLWGSAKFDGAPVKADHVLEDGDVVEFHAR